MEMSQDRISLVDFFNNRRGNQVDFFHIPPYQRPYEWQWDNKGAARKLYDDIRTASITQMGIILFHRDRDRNRINVIDGQQRLITFSLFVKALLSLREDDIANSADEDLGPGAIRRLKTCLYQLDNHDMPTSKLRLP